MRTRAQRSDIDALEAVDGANGAAKPKAKARVRGTGKRASQKAKRAEVRVGEAAYEAPKDVTETIKPPTLRAKKTRSRIEDEQREEAQRPEEDVTEATIDETGKDGLGRGAESDDDDAPEEVSLSACKKAVENQQLLESEQKRLVKEQRKKRLRERDQLNEERRKSRQAEDGAQSRYPEEANTSPLVEDILSAETIAALEEHARKRQAEAEQKPTAPVAAKLPKRLKQRQAGPLTVRILDEKPVYKPSDSALAFARQRLQEGVKRSHEMLRPKWNADRRAAAFASSGRG